MRPIEREAKSVASAIDLARAMSKLGYNRVAIKAYGFWETASGKLVVGPVKVLELHRTRVTVELRGKFLKVRPCADAHDPPFLHLTGERR